LHRAVSNILLFQEGAAAAAALPLALALADI
jgi:hypothetical protein